MAVRVLPHPRVGAAARTPVVPVPVLLVALIPSALDVFRLVQSALGLIDASLVISADRPSSMPIRIRIPSWLESGGSVKVNGKTLEAAPTPGSYLTIAHNWRNGDRIELTLPMRLRIEAMPDDRNMIAILYGPLVLAGEFGSDGLDEKMLEGPSGPPIQRAPNIDIPHLRRAGADPASWIKPADKPLTFRAAAQPQDVTLAPLNTIFGKRYTVYWQGS